MEPAGGGQGRVTETALVITISTRAAAGVYGDTSGLIILDGLFIAGGPPRKPAPGRIEEIVDMYVKAIT